MQGGSCELAASGCFRPEPRARVVLLSNGTLTGPLPSFVYPSPTETQSSGSPRAESVACGGTGVELGGRSGVEGLTRDCLICM